MTQPQLSRHRFSAHFISAAAFIVAVTASCASHAVLPVDEYLALRRARKLNPAVTLTAVEANPSRYLGKVVELRGSVNGVCVGESDVTFLLELADKRTLTLVAPPAERGTAHDMSGHKLRVLALVAETKDASLPVVPIATAYDVEVTTREEMAAKAIKAKAPSRHGTTRVPAEPSRGLVARQIPQVAGGISAMAQRYLQPSALAAYPYYRNFILRQNHHLTDTEADEITVSILYFAPKYKVDPRLVVAMIIAESSFDPRSTSHKGAMGLAQLMPDEARAYHLSNPYSPIQNIGTAVTLLKLKLNMYKEAGVPDGMLTEKQIQLTMAAYNAGSGAVRKYGGVPPYRETQGYVRRVLSLYRQLCSGK